MSTERRTQILQAFALMLEQPGSRITTANLARQVGVSEAALYRHFPSKAKMIESLIEFMEESLFEGMRTIVNEENDKASRVHAIGLFILRFAERNPGLARLLAGDALLGESDRLRRRMRQLFDRIETQLRQVLRDDTSATDSVRLVGTEESTSASASINGDNRVLASHAGNLVLATVEGRINQFVRSEFKAPPTVGWEEHWRVIGKGLFS